mmetsp:Transcript_79763/g.247379  ORF Transcript_79763/g.247379 Transcript_79763/m.247379 type:complete len:866 (-) Transcript_79763:12-2609(-)
MRRQRAPLRVLGLLLLEAQRVACLAASSDIVVGDIRVQALSPTLLRVEPLGARGFEDRTTFMVANRSFPGIPITKVDSADGTVTLRTASYTVLLHNNTGGRPTCDRPRTQTDVTSADRTSKYPAGAKVADRAACCALCDADPECFGWVLAPGSNRCWPLRSFGPTVRAGGREVGCGSRGGCGLDATPAFRVSDAAGNVIYDSAAGGPAGNLLHWPEPLQAKGYAIADFPRFFAPEWGVAPIPRDAHVDPALLPTHGYDFRNNVNGDTYVFLLGDDLAGWSAARQEFLRLSGPVPLLPDYAYGTWFTWWHSYTEAEAKKDIARWESDKLPIDVWALDMNWRRTDHEMNRYYSYPNTDLFPNFTEWFGFLKAHRLRTYFNDHPFPVASRGAGGLQTSPEETDFRWQGLSEWMARGLTFWWFDHNWGFSIPPPFVNTSQTDGTWFGLDNAAWGSHVYFSSVAQFDKIVRDPAGDAYYGRPMTLTKFGKPDWKPGMDPKGHQESPGQHRYPVWWTGDGVPLKASIESMVNAGVHDLKPFVHSDCGGDTLESGGDFLRWTAHCAFGTILRFHGAGADRAGPWYYELGADGPKEEAFGKHITGTVREYLRARYKLLPSLVAAGHEATSTGLPLVARGDLFWPKHQPDSGASDQYVFLKDLFVAPIWETSHNVTERSVWIPPGQWEDAWDGRVTEGPCRIAVKRPYEQLPLWYRHEGGLLVTASDPGLRVDAQDWSTLTLEAFPSSAAQTTNRTVFERRGGQRTEIRLATDGAGGLRLNIAPQDGAPARAWVLRLHLLPGQRAAAASVDGDFSPAPARHLEPVGPSAQGFFPLGGAGSAPAPHAGAVLELRLEKTVGPRSVRVSLEGQPLFM